MGEIETLLFQPNFSQVKRTGVPPISDPVREGSLGTGRRFHYQLYTFNLKYNTRSRMHRYLSNSADKGTKHALSNLACPQGSVHPLFHCLSPFSLLDTELTERFTEVASSLSDQQPNLEQQNEELTRLRDWLLPMLMNGQVTVG